MIFNPQTYLIPDRANQPFLDPGEIEGFLASARNPSKERVREVIGLAMNRKRLSLSETAVLLQASEEDRPLVLEAAERLKRMVYGNRMVLFAPLYVGNRCANRCTYCSFRADNPDILRKTLTPDELADEVSALGKEGHRRLILVYGEHADYDAEYIAETVRATYAVKDPEGRPVIRRVNINAAPFTVDEFRVIRQAGIGTYQVFQETYHPEAYARFHPGGRKQYYDWRLTAFDRAMEAGIDDVGLGVLLGLHDWRFEIMGLVRHTNHLEECFGVGPHTISFPRIKESSAALPAASPVSAEDFIYAIAVLRLAVPYTGLILTAREPEEIRERALRYGVSQLDGGTKLEIGGYASAGEAGGSQFKIHDDRPLDEVVGSLIRQGYLPSFCTACYRKGRTGEHFMEFSVPGFIKRFCAPNAILTLGEYLEDHAPDELRNVGYDLIDSELELLSDALREETKEKLNRIRKKMERDLFF